MMGIAQKKNRVLSIRLSNQTLIGIIDFLDIIDIPVGSLSQSIGSFLEHKVSKLRADQLLPTYNDEDAELLLSDRILMVGREALRKQKEIFIEKPRLSATPEQRRNLSGAFLSKSGLAQTDLTSDDFAPPSLNSISSLNSEFERNLAENQRDSGKEILEDLDSILQAQILAITQEEEVELLAKIKVGTVPVFDKVSTDQVLQKLASDDPRLEKDKYWKVFSSEGSELDKEALLVVYNHLPFEFWSSEKATSMLLLIKDSLRKQGGL